MDVTSDSDLATFVEPAGLMEFHEAVVVVKGVNQVSTIFGCSADHSHAEELLSVVLYDLSIEDATGDGESVELSVASLSVGQSEPLIKNIKEESRC